MRILKLRYFKALAESEHLSDTAADMYVSPSALSNAITQLESELGVQLFDRVGRNIKLNDNGRKFYRHVKKILEEVDAAYDEFREAGSRPADTLTIVTTTHVLWREAFTEFVRLYPNVAFSTITYHDLHFKPDKDFPKFDFIWSSLLEVPTSQYNYVTVMANDRPMLAVYDGHPFASRKEISLYEARNEPFVALSPQYASRHYFDSMCETAGFKPNVVAQGDYALRTSLVRSRVGICMTTLSASRTPALEGLRFVEIANPIDRRAFNLYWDKSMELSPCAQAFRRFLVRWFKEHSLVD